MKFFTKSKDSDCQNNNVLFVCVENAGRSQMAEAFFRKYSSDEYETLSAGTRPVGSINPLAVEVMREVGIDISKHFHFFFSSLRRLNIPSRRITPMVLRSHYKVNCQVWQRKDGINLILDLDSIE